jgi:hypothetical protein
MNKFVWLASYPKSGNTWFRAFLSNLLMDPDRPININNFETGPIASSRARLDALIGYNSGDLTDDEIDRLRPDLYLHEAMQEDAPAFIKVHDAYTFPSNGKPLFPLEATKAAIYFIRNPLDVCVSFTHHRGRTECQKTIEGMRNQNQVLAGRSNGQSAQLRQKLLSWSEHVLSWVDAPGQRIHVMRYEDMKLDPEKTFSAAVHFAELPSEPERIRKAIRFSRFEELRAQEEARGFRERPHADKVFFRKGQIGSWRETLSTEQAQEITRDHGEVMKRFGYLGQNGDPIF